MLSPASTPAVSVIIPTFRREDCIEGTLESVFAQTFRDFEVIVINDGSPDGTAARLKPWVESGRIRYYEQPNSGQSVARNRGICLAKGEFLALLDDDDLWPADKLEWQVEHLRRDPEAVLCYGYAQSFGLENNYRLPGGIGPQGDVGDELVRGNPISSPGQVLVRAAVVRAIGAFDPEIRGAEDWDLWIRLGRAGKFIYEDRCALHYRQVPQNSTSSNPLKMFRAGLQVLHKHAGRTPFSRRWRLWLRCRGFIGRYSSMIALGQALHAGRDRQPALVVRRLALALRFYPVLPATRVFWRIVYRSTLGRPPPLAASKPAPTGTPAAK